MAAKRLKPTAGNTPPIPSIPTIPIPAIPSLTPTTPTTTTTTTVPPGTTPSGTTKKVSSKRKSSQTRLGTVSYEQLPGDPATLSKTYAKSAGSLILNAPVGALNFFGGAAVDIGKSLLDVGSKLVPGVNFEAGKLRTTEQFAESLKETGKFLTQPLKAGSSVSAPLGIFTPASAKRYINNDAELALPERYVAALEANQSILPFLVEDFGNISMAGSLYSGIAKGAVRGVTFGEAAMTAERTAAARILDDATATTAQKAAAAERLAAVDAKLARVARTKKFLTENMKLGKDLERFANKVGALPFKPYAYGTRKLLGVWRDGVYLGQDGRYARWGAKAAAGYKKQAEKLIDEGVPMDDPRVVELVNKSTKAGSRATSRDVMQQMKEAKRDADNESGSAVRALYNQMKEPLHKEVVNPETGEAFGDMTLDEAAAVLAIQGGNAQIINRIALNWKLPPKVLALLGRYDFFEEFSLSERAAQLAYDFLNYSPETPGRMSLEQYERLAFAAENVSQAVFKQMIERAVAGYGRRNPLPMEQLVPTPFVEKLERNIVESINQAEKALKKERAKKNPDTKEMARLNLVLADRVNVLESWRVVQESGVLDLPVDNPDRIAVLKGFVDQLPIELALDPTMYSAAMRVPLEFYKRIRRGMAASILGNEGGVEVMPDGGGGPRLSPTRATKEGAVEAELSKRTKKLKELESKLDRVVEVIDKKEAQHAKLVERIVRYDIVDEFISGLTIEMIAAQNSLSPELVKNIIENSAPARTYVRAQKIREEMNALRDSMPPEEFLASSKLKEELRVLEAEAAAAQAEYENALRLAEEERQQIESETEGLTDELDVLEDEMEAYEDAYEREGGVVDDLWDRDETPALKPVTGDKTPFKKLNPTQENLRKTNASAFEKSFDSFEQLVAPQAGWKRGDVELYRPHDINGDGEINTRFLPYVKSEQYAEGHYLYSFYTDNPNSIILAIDYSSRQFVPHSDRIFIAVPETWKEFVEVLKTKINKNPTGKYKTAQNKLKKVLDVAEAQVAKGATIIYYRDQAAAAIPNERQLKLAEDYVHHYNRVRDNLINDQEALKEAIAENSEESIEWFTKEIEFDQEYLNDIKQKLNQYFPFLDSEKLLEIYKDFTFFDQSWYERPFGEETVSLPGEVPAFTLPGKEPALKPVEKAAPAAAETLNFLTPKSVYDQQVKKFGTSFPETLPKGTLEYPNAENLLPGEHLKTYTSGDFSVDVNLAASYVGIEPRRVSTGILFGVTSGESIVIDVYVEHIYSENKFKAAIEDLNDMRILRENGELREDLPETVGVLIEFGDFAEVTTQHIDLLIQAITDVATGGLDKPGATPALTPVPPAGTTDFTIESAQGVLDEVFRELGVSDSAVISRALDLLGREEKPLERKDTPKKQLSHIKSVIKGGTNFHVTGIDNIPYFSDGYVIIDMNANSLLEVNRVTDGPGIYNNKGPKNKTPTKEDIYKGSDDTPVEQIINSVIKKKQGTPIRFLYDYADESVFIDDATGELIFFNRDYVSMFGPDAKFFLTRADRTTNGVTTKKPAATRIEYQGGGEAVLMPKRESQYGLGETPPSPVERLEAVVSAFMTVNKIGKTQPWNLKKIAERINRKIADIELAAPIAAPEAAPALKPVPEKPKATKPSEVKPDPVIKNPVVREAVYSTEVIDAMAAKAAEKMDAAQTVREKLKAFQEWLDTSKKYDAEVARMKIELDPSRNARAKKLELEEKIAELRAALDELPEEVDTAKIGVESIVFSPYYEPYMAMTGGLPLDVALGGGFPSEIGGFEVPGPEGGEGVRLMGPMYYPSGVPRKFYGGIEREVTRPGFQGYKKLSSEHYRDGDRHVVFSLRQVALRMGREVKQMIMNERYRAIVTTFGSKASVILGEEFAQQLYEQAVAWADNMPQDSLYIRFRQMMAESLGEDMPISGIASPGPGVVGQKAVREWAINFRFGELIGDAMRERGFEAVDPYADIEKAIAAQNIKAKKTSDVPDTPDDATGLTPENVVQETIFLPKGLKEKMLEVVVPSNPGKFQTFLTGAQKVTSFFKTGTLVLSIPWQVGDLTSNMIIATMTGVDPRVLIGYMKQIAQEEYGTGRQGLRRMVDPFIDETGKTPLTLRRLFDREATKDVGQFRRGPYARLAGESGVQNLGASMQERAYLYGEDLKPERGVVDRMSGGRLKIVSDVAGAVTGVSFKINETINKIVRHAFFLEQLDIELRKRGQSLESIRNVENWQNDAELKKAVFDAARSANEWLGDYANLSVTERKYFTPIFPFWAWIRHIHGVFDLLAVNNPESLFYYMYLGTLASSDEEDPMNLRKGGFSVFGGVASSNWLNPFADVFYGPVGAAVLDQDLRPFGSTLGPVPRLVGGAVGIDVARPGAGLRRPVGTGGYSETGEQTSRSVLPLLGGSVSETLGFTAQQFPIVQRLLNLNPTPFENIPGTRVALGPVARYQTGEARLSPETGQRIVQPGGRGASLLRMFGGPFVPYRTDQQINDVLMAARQKLLTLDELQRLRELQGAP